LRVKASAYMLLTLVQRYANGEGVVQDDVEALRWYETPAFFAAAHPSHFTSPFTLHFTLHTSLHPSHFTSPFTLHITLHTSPQLQFYSSLKRAPQFCCLFPPQRHTFPPNFILQVPPRCAAGLPNISLLGGGVPPEWKGWWLARF
jgi:hypothetical protein